MSCRSSRMIVEADREQTFFVSPSSVKSGVPSFSEDAWHVAHLPCRCAPRKRPTPLAVPAVKPSPIGLGFGPLRQLIGSRDPARRASFLARRSSTNHIDEDLACSSPRVPHGQGWCRRRRIAVSGSAAGRRHHKAAALARLLDCVCGIAGGASQAYAALPMLAVYAERR